MALGEFEQILLLALLQMGGRGHGVPIRLEIAGRTGRDVSAGAVYTAMERLQRRGLISSVLGDSSARRGGKRPRVYQIEPAGLEEIHRSVRTLGRMTEGLTVSPETS